MRFLDVLRPTIVGTLALVALAGEAVSLPEGMTLPATYRARGTMTTTMVARVRGQTRSFANTSRARDTLTLGADGTFAWANMIGDGSPATGTWTESDTSVLSRTYDADVGPRLDVMIESLVRGFPGLRNADVTCTVIPRAVTVRRSGDRLTGTDRVDFKVRGGIARMNGRMVFRWTGRRTE
jgi:hypothetical protein